jgi:putative methionine-R-sulfoxide reductase with GAF domain
MVTYYRTELVWPPFKGKAHKVVEISTGRGVGLYRTSEGARRKMAAMNREADALNRAERAAAQG